MKTITKLKAVFIGLVLTTSAAAQAARSTSQEKILAAVFAQSEKITVVHQTTGEKSTFAHLMAETLLTTHLTLTPNIECEPSRSGKTSCILYMSAESPKENSTQKPDDDEAVMTYMISFNYKLDATRRTILIDPQASYRIDQ